MATKSELSRDADAALEAVDARMIEAEKDRAFVEAVREITDVAAADFQKGCSLTVAQVAAFTSILNAHARIYDRPCTASAKAEGK